MFMEVFSLKFETTHVFMTLDEPIAEVSLFEGGIMEFKIINSDFLPKSVYDRASFRDWFTSRKIPASRAHLDELQQRTGLSMDELLEKSWGLSLSDSYWIRPVDKNVRWKEINFFENDFTDDVGEFLVEGKELGDLFSPSNTTDGVMKKKWIIKNGIRYLVKQAPENMGTQHLNEVLSYKIAQVLGLPIIPYFLCGNNSCMCPNLVKNGQNLVPVFHWLNHHKVDISTREARSKLYPHLCKALTKKWLDGMLLLDYITMNSDRHLKNISLIQDAKTCEILGPSLIFDNGNSLMHSIDFFANDPFLNIKEISRPITSPHSRQILLADISPWQEQLRVMDTKIQDLTFNVFKNQGIRDYLIEGLAITLRTRVRNMICF